MTGRQAAIRVIRVTLRLHVLGGLSLESPRPHSLGRRPLALLALLAMAGERGISRDKIVAMLWPESDDERARSSLSQALYAIRRAMNGGGDPVSGTTVLTLNDGVITTDVAAFERSCELGDLGAAVQAYSGPFLDGFFVKGAAAFEEWTEQHRARLQTRYVSCLTRLAQAAEAASAHEDAARWWRQLAALDPSHTTAIRGAMEALAALGDRGGAIKLYRVHAAHVQREFEVEPDHALTALADELTRNGSLAGPEGDQLRPARRDDGASRLPTTVDRELGTSTPGVTPRRGSRITSVPVIAALTGLVAIGVVVVTNQPAGGAGETQAGEVAIGLFENRTPDTVMARLADVAATSIAQLLSESQRATVVDLRDSIARGTLPEATVRTEFGRVAGRSRAEHLVQGYFESSGDSVTAVAQVVDAHSGRIEYQLDAVSVPRATRDSIVRPLQELVGGAIMALNDTLFRASWGGLRPPRYSAYNEFMQGVDALVQQGEEIAIRHLLKAMTLDTEFVQAKLWYLEQAQVVGDQPARIDSVRAALVAQRPRMNAYNQAATDRQFTMFDRRLEDRYTAARRMVALAPHSPDALVLMAQAAMSTRRYRRAIEALHRLRESPGWLLDLGQHRLWDLWAHRWTGDYAGGIAEWRQWVAERPNDQSVCRRGFMQLAAAGREKEVDSLLVACVGAPAPTEAVATALNNAGLNYRASGYAREAERAFTRLLTVRMDQAARDTSVRFQVAKAHMELGQWREAYEILWARDFRTRAERVAFAVAAANVGDTASAVAALRVLEGKESTWVDRAAILAALSRRDEAIGLLTAAAQAGVVPMWDGWYLRSDLDPLRSDPRFQRLVEPIN